MWTTYVRLSFPGGTLPVGAAPELAVIPTPPQDKNNHIVVFMWIGAAAAMAALQRDAMGIEICGFWYPKADWISEFPPAVSSPQWF